MKKSCSLFLILFLATFSGNVLAEKSYKKNQKKGEPGTHSHVHRHGSVIHNHEHTHKVMHKKHSYTHHHDPDQHEVKKYDLHEDPMKN
jgi:hypothetical protein